MVTNIILATQITILLASENLPIENEQALMTRLVIY